VVLDDLKIEWSNLSRMPSVTAHKSEPCEVVFQGVVNDKRVFRYVQTAQGSLLELYNPVSPSVLITDFPIAEQAADDAERIQAAALRMLTTHLQDDRHSRRELLFNPEWEQTGDSPQMHVGTYNEQKCIILDEVGKNKWDVTCAILPLCKTHSLSGNLKTAKEYGKQMTLRYLYEMDQALEKF
jgi:hypothetical protein